MAEKLSPMMVHYLEVKKEYSDCVVFYRLGDFYEMFFDDAVEVSRELELTLTGRDCGLSERAPMCGVPFHSADVYISRLIALGYKVAICEQVEDPKEAKGMVERAVVRIITPGTTVSEAILDEGSNNYLVTLAYDKDGIGLCAADTSTGEVMATEFSPRHSVIDELASYSPKEIVIASDMPEKLRREIEMNIRVKCSVKDEMFTGDTHSGIRAQFGKSCDELHIQARPLCQRAILASLNYIRYARKCDITHINKIKIYMADNFVELDYATRRNLELTETMRDKSKLGSLFWVLDKTKTSMGRRRLKRWIERPLRDSKDINMRLLSVRELVADTMLRDDIRQTLSKTYDISRIISRIALRTVTPKDLVSLKQTLSQLPELQYILSGLKAPLFTAMYKRLDILEDVRDLIDRAVDEETASALVRDGNIIKAGFNTEVDELREARKSGNKWIDELLEEEREKTGIAKLKKGYNRVFGYYLEVTNSYKDMVPDYYIRKQTLTNAERYVTPRLKEIENTVLGADERLKALEIELFNSLRDMLEGELERLKTAAEIISVTDVLAALATVAHRNNYVMPDISEDRIIDIREGRHPVVEKLSQENIFVPNDTFLDTDGSRLMILTGPNMAGKSTYMRQTAIITLMAQIGSFVPAKTAHIGVVDRIFTRVGASDDIASGQSTFMLEMTEVTNILKHATKNSLVILDEIGRGTSTFDGLSIAWAVAEYICDKRQIGAKTMFATHYHEMTQLEGKLEGVKNFRVAVNKNGDEITFLRRIVRGGADESYGIEVAALAGVPKAVITRAKEILNSIAEGEEITLSQAQARENEASPQMGMGDIEGMEIIKDLQTMDVTTMNAIDAMNTLYKLSMRAKEL